MPNDIGGLRLDPKHEESSKSYAYFTWQENRKASKKHQPLWCRDLKKIPPSIFSKKKSFLTKVKEKITSVIGGD